MFPSSKIAWIPLIALAVGCGGSSVTSRDAASAQSAVRGAVEAGAERDPDAALHLKIARDQIARAQAALRDDEEEQAAMLLDRAELDAELAIALTRRTKAIQSARNAQTRADSLQTTPTRSASETQTIE